MEFLSENIEISAIGSFILFLVILRNIFEVKRCTNTKKVPFFVLLSLTLLILFSPILIIVVSIFTLYHEVVNVILKFKYGSKFAGLLKGADAFHMVDEPSHSVIHCLMIVKCTTKRCPDDFFESVKELLWKLHQRPKFKMIFLKTSGYSYMLNGDVSVDECIKKMKIIDCQKKKIEKTDLLSLLDNYCNAPLPKNQTLSWEVLVGTQPVNWKDDEIEYYPLLFRINHAVADGVTLMKLMVGFADMQDVNVLSMESCKSSTNASSIIGFRNSYHYTIGKESFKISVEYLGSIGIGLYNRTRKLLKLLITGLYVFLLSPASLIVTFLLKAKDCNILHGPPLSGQKILALSIEQSQEYFLKTKRIKNKVPGTTFPEVLITAFSASLADYFEKNTAYPPKHITATIPVLPESLEVQRLIPGKFYAETLNIANGYTFLLMNLPIVENENLSEKNPSLIRRLKLIKKESSILRNSIDYHVNYFLMSFVCSVLPHPIVRFILNGSHCSTIVSILPAPPKVTYCDGSMLISDVVSWAPHLHNIGTTFVINTHDNRLQIGLSVDKALIASQDVAQSIVDGVYKYLDLLAEEVDFVYPDVD